MQVSSRVASERDELREFLSKRFATAVEETRQLSRARCVDEDLVGSGLSVIFDLSNKILDHGGDDVDWLMLKAQVALEYANPHGDIVHKSAYRLAIAVLSFAEAHNQAGNFAQPPEATTVVQGERQAYPGAVTNGLRRQVAAFMLP